jgi:hypothetical protein
VCLLLDIHSSPFVRKNHTQLCAERGDQVRWVVCGSLNRLDSFSSDFVPPFAFAFASPNVKNKKAIEAWPFLITLSCQFTVFFLRLQVEAACAS